MSYQKLVIILFAVVVLAITVVLYFQDQAVRDCRFKIIDSCMKAEGLDPQERVLDMRCLEIAKETCK